jgi:hypothetical protein
MRGLLLNSSRLARDACTEKLTSLTISFRDSAAADCRGMIS